MAEIASIQIFEHQRGRRFSARLRTADKQPRIINGERSDVLTDAVLAVVVKYHRATRWREGDRGRPPAARDIPQKLESRKRSS
jgi:hypothetical protein